MKTTLVTTLLLTLLAPAAFGQYGQALKRAKEVANENNVRQGVPSPAQTRPVAPPKTSPAPSNTVTQAQSLVALQGDLAGCKPGATLSAAQKQQFTVNLAKAARSTKPSLGTVQKFVNSLTSALREASLTDAHRTRLAGDIDTVLNSRGLSATQFDKVIDDTQAILQVGTIKRPTAVSIAADLKAIGTEVRR